MTSPMFQGTYCGPAPQSAEIWLRWNLDPALLVALAAFVLILARSRSGVLAVAVLGVAFVSPLCALSSALFSARVVHHVLLVAVAAPLLASALPFRVTLGTSLPFVVATAALWGWHLPAAYDLALSNVAIYWTMQASLLISAVAFWRAVLQPGLPPGSAVLWILGAYMQMALLGALLTFAPDPLYAAHSFAPLAWDMAPLEDQQLGGLIMWVPAGLPFLVLIGHVARRDWRALFEGAT